jgi:hypothetical protein
LVPNQQMGQQSQINVLLSSLQYLTLQFYDFLRIASEGYKKTSVFRQLITDSELEEAEPIVSKRECTLF